MSLFSKPRSEKEQENYEQFMLGFRLGYPVEGDPQPTYPDTDNEQFQRGLDAGRTECEKSKRKAK